MTPEETVEPQRVPGPGAPPAGVVLAPLLWAVDQTVTRLVDRPTQIRWNASPWDTLRGRLGVMTVGVVDVDVGGLVLDRVVLRIHDARIQPLPQPRLRGGPVHVKAVVTQDGIDGWLRRIGLPVGLELTHQGVVSSARIGGLSVARVHTELTVERGWLRLRPVRAVGRDVPDAIGRLVSGNLPLPALRTGARLVGVEHRPGELVARVRIDDLDEPITGDLYRQVRRRVVGS